MPRPGNAMTPGHYKEIAEIINKLPGSELRKEVANHFATEFRKRKTSFDPMYWEKETGGTIQGFNIRTGKFADGST